MIIILEENTAAYIQPWTEIVYQILASKKHFFTLILLDQSLRILKYLFFKKVSYMSHCLS